MKQYRLWGWLLGMTYSTLAFISLTSCVDEDVSASTILSGDWNGDFGMYYDYYDRHGRLVDTFDCYDTSISFYPDYDYATYGYGYQVDYYDYGPYTKIFHTFEWEIRNQNIYLFYLGESELDTVIHEYTLGRNRFTGYFENASSRFTLRKYNDYYDWHTYCYDCGSNGYYYYDRYGWCDDYYLARTRAGATDINADELKADGQNFSIRYGNRFNK